MKKSKEGYSAPEGEVIGKSELTSPQLSVDRVLDDGAKSGEALLQHVKNMTEGHALEAVQRVRERIDGEQDVEALLAEREVLLRTLAEARRFYDEQGEAREPSVEEISGRANYRGDWTALARARLEHPVTYVKYIARKIAQLPEQKPGEPNRFQRAEEFRSFCLQQMQDYDRVLGHVFSATTVVNASDRGKQPKELGVGNYGEQPTVFRDAERAGVPLTERQKNIIESHEAGHGVRKLIGLDAREVRSVIAVEKLPPRQTTYLQNADEIAERMAQLKSYFGLGAAERFTAKHMAYAREHYVTDTGLDNSMTVLFDAVPDDRVDDFVEMVNALPI